MYAMDHPSPIANSRYKVLLIIVAAIAADTRQQLEDAHALLGRHRGATRRGLLCPVARVLNMRVSESRACNLGIASSVWVTVLCISSDVCGSCQAAPDISHA